MSVTHPDFLGALLAPAGDAEEQRHDWLKVRRANALERASALSVPTTRDEEWRFTDLSSLYRLKLKPATVAGDVESAVMQTLFLPEAVRRLVFVDGDFDPAASNLPDGSPVRAANLQHALADRWLDREGDRSASGSGRGCGLRRVCRSQYSISSGGLRDSCGRQ